MTLFDIVIKGLLFFIVLYGAIVITSLITKKINEKRDKSGDLEQL